MKLEELQNISLTAKKPDKDMTDKEAYELGYDAGKMLKKLHDIKIDKPKETWYEKYLPKMDKKINNLLNSDFYYGAK